MIQHIQEACELPPSEAMQPSYMKIMLLVLHKLKENS